MDFHHDDPAAPQALDPVCGMTVTTDSPHHAQVGGHAYYFCSARCREKFVADPKQYLSPPAKPSSGSPKDGAVYTCPMHPEVRQIGPGACPKCGMALEPVMVTASDEGDVELRRMTLRFWACLMLSVPIVVFAMGESMMQGFAARMELVFSAPVVLWGGAPFFRRAWDSIKAKSPNMFTLIGLGVGAAFGYSVVATLFPGIVPESFRMGAEPPVYFEAAAVITTLVLLGQVLEGHARVRTTGAIRALLQLAPKTAVFVQADGSEVDRPLSDIKVGDRLRVRPGDKVPVDGTLVDGRSLVDEALVTGEPAPVRKQAGDFVIGGTINGTGSFIMRADKVGDDTVVAGIVRLVAEAQRSRAPIQKLADRVSAWFVPTVILVAAVSAIAWAWFGPDPKIAHAVVTAVSVLIIACPCALGLATPMSLTVALGRGAHAGVLIRSGEALELLERVDTLVVDKTGTLTEGKPRVVAIEPRRPFTDTDVLRLASAIERASEHPIARAVVAEAERRGIDIPAVSDFHSDTGRGVHGRVEGHTVSVGNESVAPGPTADDALFLTRAEERRGEGMTVVYVAVDGRLAAWMAVEDPIKATTGEALMTLQADGVRVVMATGDGRLTAAAIARRLGLEQVHWDMKPADKAALVRSLRAEGRVVAMAGDGVNDAPALAVADVALAMGTGTDVAMEAAGVTLVKGDLRGIVRARKLGRAAMRNVRQNLLFAFGYNALGVPVAAGVLYPFFGILLSPMIAAAAMTFSSVSVIGNALRLRRVKL